MECRSGLPCAMDRAKRIFCLSPRRCTGSAAFSRIPTDKRSPTTPSRFTARPLLRGAEIQGLYCDTKIAAYLLEPGSASGYAVKRHSEPLSQDFHR